MKIARCIAFVGPYLPLDIHYAIGNFIHDGLNGGPSIVKGDGTSQRSYLYTANLAIWLWTILFLGKSGRPYNEGSEESLFIAEVTRKVAGEFPHDIEVMLLGSPNPHKKLERYIPATKRAAEELGLTTWISLADGIQKTILFHLEGG